MTNQVKLKGRTLKGKNRIREHGEIWNVLPSPVTPPLPNSLFLESVQTQETRWVHKTGDRDFDIVEEAV